MSVLCIQHKVGKHHHCPDRGYSSLPDPNCYHGQNLGCGCEWCVCCMHDHTVLLLVLKCFCSFIFIWAVNYLFLSNFMVLHSPTLLPPIEKLDWMSSQYFLCHWYFCNQTRHVGVLLPDLQQTKRETVYQQSQWLSVTQLQHIGTQRVYFARHGTKPCWMLAFLHISCGLAIIKICVLHCNASLCPRCTTEWMQSISGWEED